MQRKENLTPTGENKGVSVANSNFNSNLIKITGILTSRIETKPSSDIPAYGFFKIDNQETEIPVIFRIKDPIKSKFHDDLTTNAIKTYELEINHCPFCLKDLEKKIGIGYCYQSQCRKLFEKLGN